MPAEPDALRDAERAFATIADGGVAIVPTVVGYVILGASAAAIERIFAAKRRKPDKLNAMIGCSELHYVLHALPAEKREAVAAVTEEHDLPIGAVAPARLDHPMLSGLPADVLAQTTKDGTIAMLLNGGELLDRMALLSLRHQMPVIGSSANLSLKGVKFRVADIEPEILDAADLVVDHGLMRWHAYGLSSTMIDFRDYAVVRFGSCYELIADVLRRRFAVALPPRPAV